MRKLLKTTLLLIVCFAIVLLTPTALAQDTLPADTAPADVPAALTTTQAAGDATAHDDGHGHDPFVPPLFMTAPFVLLLLAIALLPLIPATAHWWHKNRNKFIVAVILGVLTLLYYQFRGVGVVHGEHLTEPGTPTVLSVLHHAILAEYIPFIILLFSLYTISGGIVVRGDLRATPLTNATFLGMGALAASFVGTTGASMLLIRPLLQTNRERKRVAHTVVFFIFLVSNIGGCLLPIGDPPLFLGYLRGVPFWWTANLWKEWLFCCVALLVIYYIWDTWAYSKEQPLEKTLDQRMIEPLRIEGALNFVWLAGVVAAVALVVPGKSVFGLFEAKEYYREAIMLALVGLAWATTPAENRKRNEFDFGAILEVAALFIGIFVTMQVPLEILSVKGPALGLTSPSQFFWATGTLSSFLDNAPTYVVFFQTANSMTHAAGPGILQLLDGNFIREDLLVAISLGAVFMGANTYIGNGPNFMVKSIAESAGVKMPSFFGYMAYSVCILVPLFVVVMVLFL